VTFANAEEHSKPTANAEIIRYRYTQEVCAIDYLVCSLIALQGNHFGLHELHGFMEIGALSTGPTVHMTIQRNEA
jgi:hypothetical protein